MKIVFTAEDKFEFGLQYTRCTLTINGKLVAKSRCGEDSSKDVTKIFNKKYKKVFEELKETSSTI